VEWYGQQFEGEKDGGKVFLHFRDRDSKVTDKKRIQGKMSVGEMPSVGAGIRASSSGREDKEGEEGSEKNRRDKRKVKGF